MVSCLIFKSFSHFEFIFVPGMRVFSSFIDLHAAVQVSQQYLLKIFFSHLCSCFLCQRLINHRCLGLFLDYWNGLAMRSCSVALGTVQSLMMEHDNVRK